MAMRPKFDPTLHGIDAKFRLTKFTGRYFKQMQNNK